MLTILKTGQSAHKVPPEKVQATYGRYRIQALLSVFLGYLAYYIVRNNFTLSTPYLKEQLDLSATQIGLLSSCMLIAYGISKGVMSSLADKASPKVFMACGLVLCAIVNVGLGFSSAFWIFAALVVFNGLFQGMGVGPSFITIANWFPRRERGRVGAFWNISHNVGGGIVAPIVGAAFCDIGQRTLAKRQLYRSGLRRRHFCLNCSGLGKRFAAQRRSSLPGTDDAGRKKSY
ncbi:phosphoglycerate transporter [Salmonella sp. NCTC 11881]|nr:phosphoglycerate transporter [Salmonella sp. NCTC 11881]